MSTQNNTVLQAADWSSACSLQSSYSNAPQYLFGLTVFLLHHLPEDPRPPRRSQRCTTTQDNLTQTRDREQQINTRGTSSYEANQRLLLLPSLAKVTLSVCKSNPQKQPSDGVEPHLVWGRARWETLSGGSRGWVRLWTARSCRVSRPGWWEPNRRLGNWGKKNKWMNK